MTDKPSNPKTGASPLQVNTWFLSRAEHALYHSARKVLGERFVLCPQVALGAVLTLREGQPNDPAFERIWCKRVDFVVCDAVSMNILYAIELDDPADQSPAGLERREMLRRVFESVELPLLRLEASKEYSPRELGALFDSNGRVSFFINGGSAEKRLKSLPGDLVIMDTTGGGIG